jgi:hypothetical protein
MSAILQICSDVRATEHCDVFRSDMLTATMPLLGSIVQNGKFAACACVPSQSALNSVDCTGAGHSVRNRRLWITELHARVLWSECKESRRTCLSYVGQPHNPCFQRHACCAPAVPQCRSTLCQQASKHVCIRVVGCIEYLKLRDRGMQRKCCSRICHRMPDAATGELKREIAAAVCVLAVNERLCNPCSCLLAPQLLHVLLTYEWSCSDRCILLR